MFAGQALSATPGLQAVLADGKMHLEQGSGPSQASIEDVLRSGVQLHQLAVRSQGACVRRCICACAFVEVWGAPLGGGEAVHAGLRILLHGLEQGVLRLPLRLLCVQVDAEADARNHVLRQTAGLSMCAVWESGTVPDSMRCGIRRPQALRASRFLAGRSKIGRDFTLAAQCHLSTAGSTLHRQARGALW